MVWSGDEDGRSAHSEESDDEIYTRKKEQRETKDKMAGCVQKRHADCGTERWRGRRQGVLESDNQQPYRRPQKTGKARDEAEKIRFLIIHAPFLFSVTHRSPRIGGPTIGGGVGGGEGGRGGGAIRPGASAARQRRRRICLWFTGSCRHDGRSNRTHGLPPHRSRRVLISLIRAALSAANPSGERFIRGV